MVLEETKAASNMEARMTRTMFVFNVITYVFLLAAVGPMLCLLWLGLVVCG